MSTQKTYMTADQLLASGERYELVKGELVEKAPTGGRHGRVAIRIGSQLLTYVEDGNLGEVFAAETGFVLRRDRDTVRAPDASFVARASLPRDETPLSFLEMAPDLAVEVISPSDSASYVHAKAEDWLRAGTRLVWIVYPDSRSVMVYRSLEDVTVVSADAALDGSPVFEDFSVPVADLFE